MSVPPSPLEQFRLGQRALNLGLLLAFIAIAQGVARVALVWQLPGWVISFGLAISGVLLICRGLGWARGRTTLALIALCFPLVNLLVLFALNRRATAKLRHHGFRVGVFGARPRFLPPPRGLPWPEQETVSPRATQELVSSR